MIVNVTYFLHTIIYIYIDFKIACVFIFFPGED